MKKLLAFALVFFMTSSQVMACTALNLRTKDNSIISGRTMEWAADMKWYFAYYPKGALYNLTAPQNLSLAPIKK